MFFSQTSIDSFIIYFGEKIDEKIAQQVQHSYTILKNKNDKRIKQLTPSYTSILVEFDFINFNFLDLKKWIEVSLQEDFDIKEQQSNLVEIPVYYGKEVGLDLENVAQIHKLSIHEVIEIHLSQTYLVYAIGFLPGFAYMGEVDKKIATSRLSNPRLNVPKGSVGIADSQAAIYPKKSPGGWRILGKTPLDMFDLSFKGYSFLKVGDRVKYKQIAKDEFLKMGGRL